MATRESSIPSVREQMLHECVAMARYALASGMRVPPAAAATLEQERLTIPATPAEAAADVAALARVHDQLSRLVAPATPRTLMLMGPDHAGAGRVRPTFRSIGLVQRMIIAALLSMVVYIVVSLSPEVNATVRTVQSSSGMKLFLNELAWLSAAAMGASFAMLMEVSVYVVKRNYDPRYEPSYWIKFFLGVMAGFILVQVVPLAGFAGVDPNVPQLLLALLGGFAASAVFRILSRLVEAVESLFRGDAKEAINRAAEAARARATEETSQVRVGLAAEVVKLQQEIASGATPDQLTQRLREIVGSVLPDTGQAVPAAAESPPEESRAEEQAATVTLPPDTPIIGDPAEAPTAADTGKAPAAAADGP